MTGGPSTATVGFEDRSSLATAIRDSNSWTYIHHYCSIETTRNDCKSGSRGNKRNREHRSQQGRVIFFVDDTVGQELSLACVC